MLAAHGSITAQRLPEHAIEPQLPRLAKAIDAKRHAVMPQSGLVTVGAEQAIPPGDIEAVVAFGFAPIDRVVHAMHIRRDDKKAQHSIDLNRQTDIPVVEHGCSVEHDLEDHHCDGGSAEHENGGKLDQHRDYNFARMKTQPRRNVEFQIRVMHPMQPPEERNSVEQQVLAVDRQIEQKHRTRDCEPGGRGDNVEEAPALGLGQEGYPYSRERKQQAHHERVQHHENEVVRPTEEAPDRLGSAWREDLPQCHHQQHAKEATEPERVGLSVANASQHLQQLRRVGLVSTQRDGKRVVYRLADEAEVAIVSLLGSLRHVAEHAVASMERVVATYFRARDELEPVTANELLTRLRERNAVILDVRPEDEYGLGHLPGALNIPLRQLAQRLSELPRKQEIIAYCRGPYCVLSFEAVAELRARGFNVRRLEQGFPEWKAAGLPIEAVA